MNGQIYEFSRPFQVSTLKSKEKIKKISANDEEKKALAKRFDVLSIENFEAELKVIPIDNGKRIRINGNAKAKIVQRCVVTLEEMTSEINQDINVLFDSQESNNNLKEFDISLDDEDPPELIENGEIDLGEVVSEHVGLSINPYPRKDDAVFYFSSEEPEQEEQKNNPFAVLADIISKKD